MSQVVILQLIGKINEKSLCYLYVKYIKADLIGGHERFFAKKEFKKIQYLHSHINNSWPLGTKCNQKFTILDLLEYYKADVPKRVNNKTFTHSVDPYNSCLHRVTKCF